MMSVKQSKLWFGVVPSVQLKLFMYFPKKHNKRNQLPPFFLHSLSTWARKYVYGRSCKWSQCRSALILHLTPLGSKRSPNVDMINLYVSYVLHVNQSSRVSRLEEEAARQSVLESQFVIVSYPCEVFPLYIMAILSLAVRRLQIQINTT